MSRFKWTIKQFTRCNHKAQLLQRGRATLHWKFCHTRSFKSTPLSTACVSWY